MYIKGKRLLYVMTYQSANYWLLLWVSHCAVKSIVESFVLIFIWLNVIRTTVSVMIPLTQFLHVQLNKSAYFHYIIKVYLELSIRNVISLLMCYHYVLLYHLKYKWVKFSLIWIIWTLHGLGPVPSNLWKQVSAVY